MCNLSEGVEQRGIEKGMAQGMVQTRPEILRRMLQDGVSYELAARYIGITPEERGKYEALLTQ